VIEMKAEGLHPRAIRVAIDNMYADDMAGATPTPYPPA
jgi:hypothetical protein